jgi:hypothetical protein
MRTMPIPATTQHHFKLANPTRQVLMSIALLVAMSGCADKAKPKYDECVALETKWETVKAREACKAATEISADSKYGKLAAGKLTYLDAQAEKVLAEKAKKDAPCKVGKWVTRCLYQGKPRPTLLEAETFARCNTEADEVRVVGMTCPVCECADRFVDPYQKDE